MRRLSWTGRHRRALAKMHQFERRVPVEKQDRELITRILAAVNYLRDRDAEKKRADAKAAYYRRKEL